MRTVFEEMKGVQAGFLDAAESPLFSEPILMTQVHSADVLVVDKMPDFAPECDALVSTQPNLKLTIKTADCAPVLFVDPVANVIGAAHAGWKGAFQGIMENTVLKMLELGATISNIHAAIGPHLTQQSFQAGADMKVLFPKTEHRFFKENQNGLYFDFTGYLVHRLKRAGIRDIRLQVVDTFTSPDYNSYRREPENPARQYSFINLTTKGALDV